MITNLDRSSTRSCHDEEKQDDILDLRKDIIVKKLLFWDSRPELPCAP